MRLRERRLILLTGMAAVLGVVSGATAWLLLRGIALLTNVALFSRVAFELPSFADLRPSPRIVVVATAGAFMVALLARWAPVIRGHGIPETMEAVTQKQARIAPRAAIAKPLSAAIAIGTGSPFGAEGPIIVTGGAIGSLTGQVVPVSPSERKILLACGAAAGMAATFGTPVAAVLLALELLLFEFSTRAFVPLVVAASVASGMHDLLLESGPLFEVPRTVRAGLSDLPLYAVLGLLCGGVAVVINKGLFAVEGIYRRLPVDEFWHPVLGAVVFSTLGLFAPRALGVGYDVIGDALLGDLGTSMLVFLMVAKLVIWWIALGSGTSGGTLAPVLIVASTFGVFVADAVNAAWPGLGLPVAVFGLAAMAAVFGSATQATFAAIVFVVEVTDDFAMIVPVMLAAVIANLVAVQFMEVSLMTEKLARRGLNIRTAYEVDALRTQRVADIMSRDVQTLARNVTVGTVRGRFSEATHGAYPMVDVDGRLCGIVARRDILAADAADDAPARDLASQDVVTVGPDGTAHDALQRMLEGRFGHLPVVDDDDRLLGIVTRTDITRVRMDQIDQERRQPGLRPLPWFRRRRRVDRDSS